MFLITSFVGTSAEARCNASDLLIYMKCLGAYHGTINSIKQYGGLHGMSEREKERRADILDDCLLFLEDEGKVNACNRKIMNEFGGR